MNKYSHSVDLHNLKDPEIIVPEILKIFKPKSVVDFGCGLGNFLHVFKNNGVKEILGVDGSWVDKNKLKNYIDLENFLETDLEEPLTLPKKYDMAVCLEVAEHLSEEASEILIENLIGAGEVILFSAAIPNQGGQNHINEKWITYWESLFNKHNFILHDILRPIFWDRDEIFWWYRQNMVIFAPEKFSIEAKNRHNFLKKVVHYELYDAKCALLKEKELELDQFKKGRANVGIYLHLLIKSFVGESNYSSFRKVFKN